MSDHTDSWVSLSESDPDNVGYFADDYERTHCVHGRFTGYPGGPDYMCGPCEDGRTKWVDDPLYELQFTVQTPATTQLIWTPFFGHRSSRGWLWRESDLKDNLQEMWTMAIERLSTLSDPLAKSNASLIGRVRRIEKGYWDEGDDE